MRKFLIGVVAISLFLVSFVGVFASTLPAIYNNFPSVYFQSDTPIVHGAQADQFVEFGGLVQLANGPIGYPTNNSIVTMFVSSRACESGHWNTGDCLTTTDNTFSWPITLKIYNVNTDNSPGSLITTVTKNFSLPYRSSADPVCTGDDTGKWFDPDTQTCLNGQAFPIGFAVHGITLPSKVILSISYNTSDYGPSPVGTSRCQASSGGCFYDYLYIGLGGEYTPSVGFNPLPDAIYQNATASQYCDGGTPGGANTFRVDGNCWTGKQPIFDVSLGSLVITTPTNKNQCKHGGWKIFENPTFKNQGKCVSYVQSNKKNK